ncbi:zinc finger protein 436-like isoform X1 [Ambystoma mexicanum]|uniref:zinc finger protein 436-like isoform X1 n=1 Tax=Ambystoma mexicanum TaxID=8296 RepID=UPI0037E94E16
MEIRERIPHPGSDKAPVSFQEFAGHFSKAEWRLLQEWQMELYQILMKEIHQALTSLGPLIATSVFSLRPKEKDQFSEDDLDLEIRRHNNSSPSYTIMNSDLTLRKKRKAAHHVDDPHDTNHWESQYGQSTVFPFRNFDADLKKKDEFDLDLTASVAEVKVCRSRQSSGPAIITPAASFSFVDDGNTYSTDPQHSETCGSISDPTEKAVNTAVLSFKIKEENESYFGQLDRSEIRENIISPTDEEIGQVGPLIIKEDGTTHSMDHQDLETKESMNSSKDILKRTPKYKDLVKLNSKSQGGKSTSATDKTRSSPFSERETYSRRELWSGSSKGLGNEMATMYDGGFINDINSKLHPGESSEVIADMFIKCENNMRKRDLVSGLPNEGPVASKECENRFTHAVDLTENQGSPSLRPGLGTINAKRKRSYQCTESEKNVDQMKNQMPNETALTTENRYTCAKCHKHFSQMRSLIRHQTIHSKERPHQCTECDKSFNRHDNLVRHQRSHIRDFQAQLDVWPNAMPPYELQNEGMFDPIPAFRTARSPNL